MNRSKTLYWVITGLMIAFMLASSIPSILYVPGSVAIISTHLGYPTYFIRFTGVAKLLGVIAILIPGFPRIKEWAYAGFVFDLLAALYSGIMVGDPVIKLYGIILGLILVASSYFLYHKKINANS